MVSELIPLVMLFLAILITYGWYKEIIPEVLISIPSFLIGIILIDNGYSGLGPAILVVGGGLVSARHIYYYARGKHEKA